LHTNSPYTAPRREAGGNTSPAASIKFDTATREVINHPAPPLPAAQPIIATRQPRHLKLTRRPARTRPAAPAAPAAPIISDTSSGPRPPSDTSICLARRTN